MWPIKLPISQFLSYYIPCLSPQYEAESLFSLALWCAGRKSLSLFGFTGTLTANKQLAYLFPADDRHKKERLRAAGGAADPVRDNEDGGEARHSGVHTGRAETEGEDWGQGPGKPRALQGLWLPLGPLRMMGNTRRDKLTEQVYLSIFQRTWVIFFFPHNSFYGIILQVPKDWNEWTEISGMLLLTNRRLYLVWSELVHSARE